MSTSAEMTIALKEVCVPVVRELGFKGSFPNFYRANADFVALVNFQFSTVGGCFCVNLGYADPQRHNVVSIHKHVEPKKLKVSSTNPMQRHRLGASEDGDSWFTFRKVDYAPGKGEELPVKGLAQIVSELLNDEAETWFRHKLTQAADQ